MRSGLLTYILITVICTYALAAQTTSFTYQGRLNDTSVAANGTYEMQFALFDAVSGGTQIGSTITNSAVSVVNGIFTLPLDFGAGAFPGAERFLQINVRPSGSPNAFTGLSPRQPLTSSPYSVKSLTADNAAQLGGLPANTYLQTNGNGSALTNLNGTSITPGTVSAAALASDTFPNSRNLSLLGSLRWDLLRKKVAVGFTPRGIAFDGSNIWVANGTNSKLTKVRASDGAVQMSVALSSNPQAIVFDGTNIWATLSDTNSVEKIRANDGAEQGVFPVGTSPKGIAFDGTNIWIVNSGSNNVSRLSLSGVANGTFPVGTSPVAIAFDGTNMWVTNSLTHNVTKLLANDGANQGTFLIRANFTPGAIAFDGANMWITGLGEVVKLRVSDSVVQGTFSTPLSNIANISGIVFDGANMWISSNDGSSVTKLRASDGTNLGTYLVGTFPSAIAFDGTNIWVTSIQDSSVLKMPVFP